MFGWLKKRRRKKILAAPWPEAWSLHLNRNVRLTWELSSSETRKLRSLIKVFVAEKNWESVEGVQLTEEMRVTVAGNACLMLLGVDDFYFDNVKTILIRPHYFEGKSRQGFIVEEGVARSGEAWQGGPIILSWPDTLEAGRNEDDGQNLVIHEFAHALDGLDGAMVGTLQFDDEATSEQWQRVVNREYEELAEAQIERRRTVLDHYGATNPAEFFAVSSETFFEQPRLLKQYHPELSGLLEKYYKVDPSRWQRN